MRTNRNKTDVDTAKTITHISLCSGYGGIDLGLKRCLPTLRTILACEIEAYAVAQLVSKMEAGQMDACPVWTDLKTCDWELYRDRVDILSGGYPCQPFSAAGRRKGKEDPRHLWPFIQRAIAVIRPGFCFFENVEGHLTLGFKDVCHDLGELGYELTAGIFSASEVGAPHQRKRIFILAQLADGDPTIRHGEERPERERRNVSAGGSECSGDPRTELANDDGRRSEKDEGQEEISESKCFRADSWPSRPGEDQQDWEESRVMADTGRKSSGAEGFGLGGKSIHGKAEGERAAEGDRSTDGSGEEPRVVGDSNSEGLEERERETGSAIQGTDPPSGEEGNRQTQSELGRTTPGTGSGVDATTNRVDAVANRIDRLRLLGNGVVPAVAEKAFRILYNQLREQTKKENE